MIIVSQEKDIIANFENIEMLGIGNPLEDDDGKFKILANTTSDNQYAIGKYETEKRAKEVLQEVIDAILGKSSTTMTQESIVFEVSSGLYEMPEV